MSTSEEIIVSPTSTEASGSAVSREVDSAVELCSEALDDTSSNEELEASASEDELAELPASAEAGQLANSWHVYSLQPIRLNPTTMFQHR